MIRRSVALMDRLPARKSLRGVNIPAYENIRDCRLLLFVPLPKLLADLLLPVGEL